MDTAPTQDQIVERIAAVAENDWLGFRREVLVQALDFAHAKPFLRDGVTEDQWPTTDLAAEAAEYLTFAIEKILDHRGISANRSVDKLCEYAWLLGRHDVVSAMESVGFAQYGAPKVKAFAVGLDLPWPDDPALARMAAGESCYPGCDEGCGT